MRKNIIFERAVFNRRNQLEGETAEQYIMEVYKLAYNCEYGDMKTEMIRDRLVVGIRDAALSQLQLDPGKKKIRQREAVTQQQQVLNGKAADASIIEEVHSKRQQFSKKQNHRPGKGKPQAKTAQACTRCGREQHPREKCPAKDATCHRCQKKVHYSSQCFAKQVAEVATDSYLESAYLDTVQMDQTSAWKANIEVNGHTVNFKLDTGAEVTAISSSTYKSLKEPQLATPEKILYGPSRQPLKVIGRFWGEFSYKDRVAKQLTFVVDGLKTNLLGLPAITALGLAVQADVTTEDKTDIQEQFPHFFKGWEIWERSTRSVSSQERHLMHCLLQGMYHYHSAPRLKRS